MNKCPYCEKDLNDEGQEITPSGLDMNIYTLSKDELVKYYETTLDFASKLHYLIYNINQLMTPINKHNEKIHEYIQNINSNIVRLEVPIISKLALFRDHDEKTAWSIIYRFIYGEINQFNSRFAIIYDELCSKGFGDEMPISTAIMDDITKKKI